MNSQDKNNKEYTAKELIESMRALGFTEEEIERALKAKIAMQLDKTDKEKKNEAKS